MMRDDIEFNIEFCQLVEKYPIIYDYTKSGYSNRNVQDKIWQEIAIKVGATGKIFILFIHYVCSETVSAIVGLDMS